MLIKQQLPSLYNDGADGAFTSILAHHLHLRFHVVTLKERQRLLFIGLAGSFIEV
jgi:hypothetical protein